jgi:hypothetical protein
MSYRFSRRFSFLTIRGSSQVVVGFVGRKVVEQFRTKIEFSFLNGNLTVSAADTPISCL